MAIHVTTSPPRRLVRRLTRPLALVALLLPGSAALSAADEPAQRCGDRDQILKTLQQRHAEKPSAVGLSADGGVLEILVSPEGGWTILVTYPERPTCVLAVGEAWQTLPAEGRPA